MSSGRWEWNKADFSLAPGELWLRGVNSFSFWIKDCQSPGENLVLMWRVQLSDLKRLQYSHFTHVRSWNFLPLFRVIWSVWWIISFLACFPLVSEFLVKIKTCTSPVKIFNIKFWRPLASEVTSPLYHLFHVLRGIPSNSVKSDITEVMALGQEYGYMVILSWNDLIFTQKKSYWREKLL